MYDLRFASYDLRARLAPSALLSVAFFFFEGTYSTSSASFSIFTLFTAHTIDTSTPFFLGVSTLALIVFKLILASLRSSTCRSKKISETHVAEHCLPSFHVDPSRVAVTIADSRLSVLLMCVVSGTMHKSSTSQASYAKSRCVGLA